MVNKHYQYHGASIYLTAVHLLPRQSRLFVTHFRGRLYLIRLIQYTISVQHMIFILKLFIRHLS